MTKNSVKLSHIGKTTVNNAIMKTLNEMNLDSLTDTTGMQKGNKRMQRLRVTIGYNDDGTPIHKRLQAQTEESLADRVVQTYVDCGRISEFLTGEYTAKPKNKTSFRSYAEQWLKVFIDEGEATPRTKQTYHSYMQAHIYPMFGKMCLEDITPEDLQRFISHLSSDHSGKSVKNYYGVLRQIIRAAVDDKIIIDDPTRSRRIRLPKVRKHQRKALTIEQMKDILSAMNTMNNSPEKLLLAVLIYTGIRRGEALGLRWDDIDMEKESSAFSAMSRIRTMPRISETQRPRTENVLFISENTSAQSLIR